MKKGKRPKKSPPDLLVEAVGRGVTLASTGAVNTIGRITIIKEAAALEPHGMSFLFDRLRCGVSFEQACLDLLRSEVPIDPSPHVRRLITDHFEDLRSQRELLLPRGDPERRASLRRRKEQQQAIVSQWYKIIRAGLIRANVPPAEATERAAYMVGKSAAAIEQQIKRTRRGQRRRKSH
jgi:hypothetical protein